MGYCRSLHESGTAKRARNLCDACFLYWRGQTTVGRPEEIGQIPRIVRVFQATGSNLCDPLASFGRPSWRPDGSFSVLCGKGRRVAEKG